MQIHYFPFDKSTISVFNNRTAGLVLRDATVHVFSSHYVQSGREGMNPYDEAHLFVAAIRLFYHQKGVAPSVEDICSMLDISLELGLSVCRKLKKLGIVDIAEDPFALRLSIANHLEIEKLPKKPVEENSLAKELEQFMAKKKNMDKKVEALQAEIEAKKRSMFSEIETNLKQKMQKKDKQ